MLNPHYGKDFIDKEAQMTEAFQPEVLEELSKDDLICIIYRLQETLIDIQHQVCGSITHAVNHNFLHLSEAIKERKLYNPDKPELKTVTFSMPPEMKANCDVMLNRMRCSSPLEREALPEVDFKPCKKGADDKEYTFEVTAQEHNCLKMAVKAMNKGYFSTIIKI